jgi:uncharacterized membrane protein YphA (DoxX/SURF4 family)
VLALVALRLSLGCHFLYEGVWKIAHRDEFSAEPFLSQAKGPLAGFFYAMLPDIDGRERLRLSKDADGTVSVDSGRIASRWDRIRKDFVDFYKPANSSDAQAAAVYAKLAKAADETTKTCCTNLDEYLKENVEEIAAYFKSLDQFEQDPQRFQSAPYQKQRRWEQMVKLRGQADVWIKEIEAQERAFESSLYGLLDNDKAFQELKDRGRVPHSWNLLRWDRMEQINFAVTYGLTAIGACLMLGLCTRLAALGGAAFMAFVVMTQPAFPGIYPPDSPIVGHALLVNKDFIEMIALLAIAAVGAGRWGGLDFFFCRRRDGCCAETSGTL